MNTVSPEAFYTFQQVLMHVCLWATVGLGVILFFIKVVCPGWDGIRKFFSKEGIKSIILIPSIVGISFYGMTKGGYSGHITYDGGIKSGTTSNFVSNDVIRIYWQRDISGGVWVPDAAAVYIDYREIGDNSAEWGLLAQSTVGAGSWEGSIENATNFDYNVWAYYIPPEPVHTNGVWIYKTLKDRMNANALPLARASRSMVSRLQRRRRNARTSGDSGESPTTSTRFSSTSPIPITASSGTRNTGLTLPSGDARCATTHRTRCATTTGFTITPQKSSSTSLRAKVDMPPSALPI